MVYTCVLNTFNLKDWTFKYKSREAEIFKCRNYSSNFLILVQHIFGAVSRFLLHSLKSWKLIFYAKIWKISLIIKYLIRLTMIILLQISKFVKRTSGWVLLQTLANNTQLSESLFDTLHSSVLSKVQRAIHNHKWS